MACDMALDSYYYYACAMRVCYVVHVIYRSNYTSKTTLNCNDVLCDVNKVTRKVY